MACITARTSFRSALADGRFADTVCQVAGIQNGQFPHQPGQAVHVVVERGRADAEFACQSPEGQGFQSLGVDQVCGGLDDGLFGQV